MVAGLALIPASDAAMSETRYEMDISLVYCPGVLFNSCSRTHRCDVSVASTLSSSTRMKVISPVHY